MRIDCDRDGVDQGEASSIEGWSQREIDNDWMASARRAHWSILVAQQRTLQS